MNPNKALKLWMAGLLITVTSSFLFLYSLGIAGTINMYLIFSVIITLLYALRIKRKLKWMVRIIPLVMALLGVAGYITTLLLDSSDSFGVGLLFAFSMVMVLLSLLSMVIYQILERSYYPQGFYQKTDQTYLSNEWILFVFVINMLLFQVIDYVMGLEFLRMLLEIGIVIAISVMLYFILFFINKRQKNMNLFSLVGLLFFSTYIGYAYISKTYIPFYLSSGSHVLLIYFLIKDHFNKKADKREQSQKH
jgi:hypothetical protein